MLLALSAPSPAAAQETPAHVDFSIRAAGRVALTLESDGAPLQVVVERRIDRPAAEARDRGVVLGSGRCQTPCALWVPPGVLRLRANAPGVRATDEDVSVPAGGATLRVRAGRAAVHNVGVGLVAVGATAILATMFVALADQGIFAGSDRGSLDLAPAAVVGAASVGAALLAGGIPLLLLHRNGVARVAEAVPVVRVAVSPERVGVGVSVSF